MTPAFIISFNRLTALNNLCEELVKRECWPIIVDNGSTYKPILEWYNKATYNVHYLTGKYGHQCVWEDGIIESYNQDYYIVTDPDLDISSVPLDMVDHLKAGFKHANVTKVGLSLEIIDLPYNDYTKEVIAWERKFWQAPVNNGYLVADIDTTLALYKDIDPTGPRFFSALRADRPYTAKHLPWYNVPPLNEEEQYYITHMNQHTYWKERYIKIFNK